MIIHVVCEGRTESNFVKKILSTRFYNNGIVFNSPIIVTKNDEKNGKVFKGGCVSYQKFKETLSKILPLTSKPDNYVTTMIDYYKIPTDMPGYNESKKIVDIYKKVEFLELKIRNEFSRYSNFFPYIQLHEFESPIFTNLDKLAEKYFDYSDKIKPLKECLEKFVNPEMINSSEQTAPSKRIRACIPIYDKCNVGISILEETDFLAIRKNCSHFNLSL